MNGILHVDQSNLFRNIMKDILIKRGLNYEGVKNSEEALAFLSQNEVKLIITSLELEDVSGVDFINQLSNSEFKNIPVIVVTSTDSLEIREKIFSLGVIDYILKKDLSYQRFDWYIDNLMKEDQMVKELQGMHIAVLDDSNYSLNVIRHIFEMNKIYQVDYFTDPKALLESPKKYSVFLLDYIIPDMSGKELILTLRSRYQKSVIISISGITNYKTISNVLMAGANDYIMKPFDKNIFMARLKTNVRTLLLLKKLERMAITDSLTSAYNHRQIHKMLEEEIEKISAGIGKLSVVIFDLDHFKSINDTYGHPVGDMVLVKITNAIRSILSNGGILGRYGGEEFLAVLPELDKVQAWELADAVRRKIGELSFPQEGLKVTISGGVAEWNGESGVALVNVADSHLYQAKSQGRDRIEG